MLLFERIIDQISGNLEKQIFISKYHDNTIMPYLETLEDSNINKLHYLIQGSDKNAGRKDKITDISKNINIIVKIVVNFISLNCYEFIKLLLDNNGEIPYNKKDLGIINLFKTYGICYPVIKNKQKMIIMPVEIMNCLHELLTDMNVYLIEQNTRITKYIRGLINLYGIIDKDFLNRKITSYLSSPINLDILSSIIYFDSAADFTYYFDGQYLISAFIYQKKKEYIKQQKNLPVDYYPFTDDEIIKACDINNLLKDISSQQHVVNYANLFHIPYEEAKEQVLTLLYILKEDIHYELLISFLNNVESIMEFQSKLEFIMDLNENIPKWSLKGHKYNDLKLKNKLNIMKLMEIIFKKK